MKKKTRQKLVNTYWITIYLLAFIGILGIIKYLVYETFY